MAKAALAAQVERIAAAGPPSWPRDPDGRIHPQHEAEFWRPLADGRIACDLCYRRCEIGPGESGWCRARRNVDGRMELVAHGVLSCLVRQMSGYKDHGGVYYKPGAPSLALGGVGCSSRCRFCVEKDLTWRPERVPWIAGEFRDAADRIFFFHRGIVHPTQAVALARLMNCSQITLGINEPTLTWEYTYDVARLAKANGLDVSMDTNALTTPEAVRRLAPYVDAVEIGLKGSGEPRFYERWMRSPGGAEAVRAACKAWREAGVHIMVGDLIAPAQMQTDKAHDRARRQFYTWIAEELGPTTPLRFQAMMVPGLESERHRLGGLLLRPGATEADALAYVQRLHDAKEAAKECGLLYATIARPDFQCHACGGLLLRFLKPMMDCKPCTMESHFCIFWEHEQHVSNGRCDHCGAEVPIVTLTAEELAASQRYVAEWSKLADSVSNRVSMRPGDRGPVTAESYLTHQNLVAAFARILERKRRKGRRQYA